jgi:hypothetical protein
MATKGRISGALSQATSGIIGGYILLIGDILVILGHYTLNLKSDNVNIINDTPLYIFIANRNNFFYIAQM